MPRFIDILRRQPPVLPYSFEFDGEILRKLPWAAPEARYQSLKNSVAFVSDSIAEYVYGTEQMAPTKTTWNWKDFPMAAPPFTEFWVEWTQPILEDRRQTKWMGVHFYLDDSAIPNEFRACRFQLHGDLYFYSDRYNTGIGPIAHWYIPVDGDGQIQSLHMLHEKEAPQDAILKMTAAIVPPLVTIAFCHVPKIKRETVQPPRELQKKYTKKHGVPLVQYKVLHIEPMKEVLERVGQASKRGILRAMSMVVGHYKTYTPERPLFGKLAGRFYWRAHWAGDKVAGMIIHDARDMGMPKIKEGKIGKRRKAMLDELAKWGWDQAAATQEQGVEGENSKKAG